MAMDARIQPMFTFCQNHYFFSENRPRKAARHGRRTARGHPAGGPAGAAAKPPAALHHLQLQDAARRRPCLLSNVLHFLHPTGLPDGAVHAVRQNANGAATRGRSDALLRDSRAGRNDRGLAEGKVEISI
uniref:(northern house mosquito) hypothetical protein n=1 Tax=Culex pipiens TaxID=7175 RepID=A0A8D8C658_CULPI